MCELNIKIAESLGWLKSITVMNDYYYGDMEVNFYHPKSLTIDYMGYSEAESSIIEYDGNEDHECWDDWVEAHGVIPDFVNDFGLVEDFIIPEINKEGCLQILTFHLGYICSIIGKNPADRHISIRAQVQEYASSLPLAICLAWLSFKGVQPQLLDKEGVSDDE